MDLKPIDLVVISTLTGQPLDSLVGSHEVQQMGLLFIQDSLTGLYNRRYLQKRLAMELDAAKETTRRITLLMIDLDGFKQVNDFFGHDAGDQLLVEAALTMIHAAPADSVVSRYGGDEFVVLLPNSTTLEAIPMAQSMLDQIRAVMERCDAEGSITNLGASIGIATWPDDADGYATLLVTADEAMYRAKRHRLGVTVADHTAKDGPRQKQRARPRRAASAHFEQGIGTVVMAEILSMAQLQQEFPSALSQAVERFDELFTDGMERFGGTAYGTDTVHGTWSAVFATVEQATHAATEFGLRLQVEPWPAEVRLNSRMALHTASVRFDRGTFHGAAIGMAHELLRLAPPGQIILSQSSISSIAGRIAPGVSFEHVGEHRLPDLHESTSLYRLVHPFLVRGPEVIASLSTVPNNLPMLSSVFVGRAAEIATIENLLTSSRLVTLTAIGGGGKTRLALHVAARLPGSFPDGIWFVSLAPIHDSAQVPQAAGLALGIKEHGDEPLVRTLCHAFRQKRSLIILDNCEHVTKGASALAAALLAHCPAVQILATSRLPLKTSGETIYRIPPLAMSDPSAPVEIAVQDDAVQLFLRRAFSGEWAQPLSRGEMTAVVGMCRKLGGVPLAIELTAATVTRQPVHQVATQIDYWLTASSGMKAKRADGSDTLWATIDWSYGLMSKGAQELCRRLSVFSSGFTLPAAVAVCADDSLPSSAVEGLLGELVEWSVLTGVVGENALRFSMLGTVREYMRGKLKASGEEAECVRRHLDWYLSLAQQAELQWRGADPAPWQALMRVEHDNFCLALDRVLKEPVWLDQGLRLGGALPFYWDWCGLAGEGRSRIESLLALAEGDSIAKVRALQAAGYLANAQFDLAAAEAYGERTLAMQHGLGDSAGQIARTLYNLGVAATNAARYEAALAFYDQAANLALQSGDRQIQVACLMNTGGVAMEKDQLPKAQAALEESLMVARSLGSQHLVSLSLTYLFMVYHGQGRYDRASELLKEQFALARDLGVSHQIEAFINDADITFARGEFLATRTSLDEVIRLAQASGGRHYEAMAVCRLGMIAKYLGDFAQAESTLQAALTLTRDGGLLDTTAVLLRELGDTALRRGALATARDQLGESLRESLHWGRREYIYETLNYIVSLLVAEGRWEAAARLTGGDEQYRLNSGRAVHPVDLPRRNKDRTALENALGRDQFGLLRAEGAEMALSALTALAFDLLGAALDSTIDAHA